HRYAGKSGTTNTDSWMIGYTPELVTTVWTGYDEGQTLDGVEVNRYAKNIWASVMENSLKESGSTWFETPKTLFQFQSTPYLGTLQQMTAIKK
ncbi:MAG: penicillin-binding protein, partial [Turicibacter sanguinis]